MDWTGQIWATLQNMHWAEMAAVGCGVAYVILAAREHILCWLFGIANGILSVYVFLRAGLLAEAGLYAFYILAGIYGWYTWLHGPERDQSGGDSLRVAEWGWLRHVAWILAGVALSLGLAYVLQSYTPAEMPLIDAHTTVFSFLATYMVTRKILSNWLYWIAIDGVSVWLYATRDLYLYSLLMLAYTGIAIWGYFSWRRQAYTISTVS
mgnify:CR=1 FL=1